MAIFLLILGLVLFVGLVVVHEFGHFWVARRNGVQAEEFGIGFPPAFFKKRIKSKKGDFDFTLNLLPLGGFVKLKGEHDADTAKGSFGAASTWSKTKIMAAGVVMNFIAAFVLLLILALIGLPKLVSNQFTVASDTTISKSVLFISYVEPHSPAERAGLKTGDELTSISSGGRTVHLSGHDQLHNATQQFADKTVSIAYTRQGTPHTATATLRSQQVIQASIQSYDRQLKTVTQDCATITPPKGYLGVEDNSYTLQRSTWSAPVVAGGLMGQFTVLTFQGLGRALAGLGSLVAGFVTDNNLARQNGGCAASSQVSGPVGIYFILKSGSLLGYNYILFIIAVISLTLAIMNILPIPALDGGRLWLTLISRAIGRPMSQRTEEIVTATGFFVLIGLIILITYVDIRHFF